MKGILISFNNVVTKINRTMVWLTGIFVLCMSILLTIDVLLRYFFNSPTGWAFDLATWGTGLVGLVLGGYVMSIGKHVRVDFFFEKFSLRVQSMIDMISTLFLYLIVISFVWLGFDYVAHYYRIGAVSTGGTQMPLWIQWLIIPVGGLLIGLQGLCKFVEDLYIIATGKKLYDSEIIVTEDEVIDSKGAL